MNITFFMIRQINGPNRKSL